MATSKKPSRDKIAGWISKNELSIGKTAKRCGMPKSTLVNILSGTTPCLYDHAVKIAKVMGIRWKNLVENKKPLRREKRHPQPPSPTTPMSTTGTTSPDQEAR